VRPPSAEWPGSRSSRKPREAAADAGLDGSDRGSCVASAMRSCVKPLVQASTRGPAARHGRAARRRRRRHLRSSLLATCSDLRSGARGPARSGRSCLDRGRRGGTGRGAGGRSGGGGRWWRRRRVPTRDCGIVSGGAAPDLDKDLLHRVVHVLSEVLQVSRGQRVAPFRRTHRCSARPRRGRPCAMSWRRVPGIARDGACS
jgi:hypothetical protein